MKLSLKCACGAEFNGEDSGTGYSVMVRSDNWLAMHKPCLNKPQPQKPITLGHSPRCASLTRMLLCDPPRPAPCDCGFETELEADDGNK